MLFVVGSVYQETLGDDVSGFVEYDHSTVVIVSTSKYY